MKLASFDLESAQTFPDDCTYQDEHFEQLGITCAAAALIDMDNPSDWSETEEVQFWHSSDVNRLTKSDCCDIVDDCMQLVDDGYTFLTWNGLGFDFRLLAVQSGMFDECANIAYNHHIDMMMFPVFIRGHFLGLQKCLEGIQRYGKLSDVRLNDGTIINNMKGALAPEMWAKGEFSAVLTYLNYDVTEPLALAQYVHKRKRIQWISSNGNPQSIDIPRLITVKEIYETYPDNAKWDRFNIRKEQFIEWMPFMFRKHKTY